MYPQVKRVLICYIGTVVPHSSSVIYKTSDSNGETNIVLISDHVQLFLHPRDVGIRNVGSVQVCSPISKERNIFVSGSEEDR